MLLEASNENQLTHLEYAEDHHIINGADGFNHAFNTLHSVHQRLKGEESDAKITTKYDGSPSIVFGHHPKTNRFFVASKSIFNKNPKINYTVADIKKNHGHAPGLVSKLTTALRHLPKVTPSSGLFQGDFMYSHSDNDISSHDGSYHFTPNTITYSTEHDSPEGRKIAKSKIGVAIHTRYAGPTLDQMKAQHGIGHDGFKSHRDVHLIDVHPDLDKVNYTSDAAKSFVASMQKAMKDHVALDNYDHHTGHIDYMKMYINNTVEGDEKPSTAGYKQFLHNRFNAEAAKLKTDAGKQRRFDNLAQMSNHVDNNKKQFDASFNIHNHLQAAKDVLVHTLSQAQDYRHSVDDQPVKPEGFVAVINNRPTKLVDRNEFSKMNRLRIRN